jgi:prephenate dehydrogenase
VSAPFRHVAIVGAGLVGGSIALAVRRASPAVRITVVDRPDVAEAALARRAADDVALSAEEVRGVELVVLATPIQTIVDALTTGHFAPGSIVTDVGSTKRRILAAANEADIPAFVGGHPMAGRERGGFAEASADLFDGRRWFLVAGDRTARTATERVAAFVESLGAVPHEVGAEVHDRTMAYVSHLPQIVASLLMRRVEVEVGTPGLASAGRGLDDTTRLASSPTGIWQGILESNADFVAEAVAALSEDLGALGHRLDEADEVARAFDAGRLARDRWLATRSAR